MPIKDASFNVSKFVVLLVSVVVLFYMPKYIRYAIIVNIMMTVPFAMAHPLNIAFATLLSITIMHVKNTYEAASWIVVYVGWNIHFCVTIMKYSLINSICANIIPMLFAFAVIPKSYNADEMIFNWAFARIVCIFLIQFVEMLS